MKKISILGSTGSIGTQTLQVIAEHSDDFQIIALGAYQNDRLLEQQIEQFHPQIAVLVDEKAATRLRARYKGNTKILSGETSLLNAADHPEVDIVVTSMVGFAGLKPTIAAIKAGKIIALANKETLVAAGEIIMPLAKQYNSTIIPVDSEHCALLQCLQGEKHNQIKQLILTASGGPFRQYTKQQMNNISVGDCLKHPNWSMGQKITIDSATLANKGLEVIEAHWLFDIDYDQIQVVVHPQSIIHSMVEFIDGSIMAQLAAPDMRIPIQYALTYPNRAENSFKRIDFTKLSDLSFHEPNYLNFPALALAYQAGKLGGTMPCVFNAANETAVHAFMQARIAFLSISAIIEAVMNKHDVITTPTLDDIFKTDTWARTEATALIDSISQEKGR